MESKKVNVRYMTQLALLIAIELVMKLLGLGSVPVGPLNMSFLTVPVAVGAILMGPVAGAALGAVFGLASLYDAISGASLMTGTFFQISPLHTIILCVGTRVLMGFCAGWVFRLLSKMDKQGIISYVVSALATPLLNTLFFMGYIILAFYHCDYVQNLVAAVGAANPLMFVVLVVGVQGLIEAVVCAVVGSAVSKGVAVALKKK